MDLTVLAAAMLTMPLLRYCRHVTMVWQHQMLSSSTSSIVPQLREIAVGNSGGVASVHIDGFEQLMPIFIGVAEAAALVYATTRSEGRRPSTLGTWKRSLEVGHARNSTLQLLHLHVNEHQHHICFLYVAHCMCINAQDITCGQQQRYLDMSLLISAGMSRG